MLPSLDLASNDSQAELATAQERSDPVATARESESTNNVLTAIESEASEAVQTALEKSDQLITAREGTISVKPQVSLRRFSWYRCSGGSSHSSGAF